MSKHIKLPKTKPVDIQAGIDGMSMQVDDLMQAVININRDILASIHEAMITGEGSPALARETANITRAITGMSGEMRQRQKQARDMILAMPPGDRNALVANYLRTLPDSELAEFRDILGAGSASEGLLS
jgi:hypothetical protein